MSKISLAPFFNWFNNSSSDVWSSPTYFQRTKNISILPPNDYFKREVGGFFAYGAKNCVIVCQIHGDLIRYAFTLKAFASIYEKVTSVSFARCLQKPKLFIGSNQGNVIIYHFEEKKIQTVDIKLTIKLDKAVTSSDWANNHIILFAIDTYIVQWNIDENKSYNIDLTAPSGCKCKIDSIVVTKVDPLMIAVAFTGGQISILKIAELCIANHILFTNLNHGPSDVCSLAFPFDNGGYDNGILASITRGGTLKVWELDSHRELFHHQFETKSKHSKAKNFYSIAFVPLKPDTTNLKSTSNLDESYIEISSDPTQLVRSISQLDLKESISYACNVSNCSAENEVESSLENEPSDSVSDEIEPKACSSNPPISDDGFINENAQFVETGSNSIKIDKTHTPDKTKSSKMKLLVTKSNGDMCLVDVPLDNTVGSVRNIQVIASNYNRKHHKISHYNVVFNVSVVNPFHYTTKEKVRNIRPFWDMPVFAVSISLDRQVIFWDLNTSEHPAKSAFQTLSHQVHELEFNPYDSEQLAIACGDGLKIWRFNHNPHRIPSDNPAYYRITNIHSNLPSNTKILSLAWLPKKTDTEESENSKQKKNIIAVGTDCGEVFCIDLSSSKLLYTHKIETMSKSYDGRGRVYSLKWGPIPVNYRSGKEIEWAFYAVYSSGDVKAHVPTRGETFNLDELSVNLIHNSKKTECVWKDDFNYLAIGYDDGDVIICLNDGVLKPIIRLEKLHSQFISCIRWHPDYMRHSDEFVNAIRPKVKSNFESWIAIGSCDKTIQIVDLQPLLKKYNMEKQEIIISKESKHTLTGHNDRVISLAWSTCVAEFLASCSADSTVQIWHVQLGLPLHNFRGHWSRIFCVTWAPWEEDLLFSAGDDSTVQAWVASEQTSNLPPDDSEKIWELKEIDELLTDQNVPLQVDQNCDELVDPLFNSRDTEILIVPPPTSDTSETHSAMFSSLDQDPNIAHQATSSNEPKSNASNSSSSRSPSILSKLIYPSKSLNEYTLKEKKRSLLPLSNITENCSTKLQTISDIEYLMARKFTIPDMNDDQDARERNLIFLEKGDIAELCEKEINNHKQNKNLSLAFQVSVLNGNLKDMISEAAKTHQLNDWMVALSASVSREFWSKTALLYALQLEKSGDSVQSALYYSSTHHIIDAVRVLIKAGLYKEALILVKSGQFFNSQLIKDILDAWAKTKESQNNFEAAAKIFVANTKSKEAARCLSQRTDDPKCQSLSKILETAQPLVKDSEVDLVPTNGH